MRPYIIAKSSDSFRGQSEHRRFKCLCLNVDSDIKGSLVFMLFTIMSHHFSSINWHGFQRICEMFVRKDFSKFFYFLWAFYSEKSITESKCLFGGHDNRSG